MLDQQDKKPLQALMTLTLLGYIVPFLRFGQTIGRDWRYFNDLSLLVRSSVLEYGVFPLHDPWRCGGLDVLTNPQTRILSPFLLFDVALPPLWANWVSVIALACAGAIGAYVMFRDSFDRWTSAALASVFVNGSWFALHVAEGHIPFAFMFLLPWVVVCVTRIAQRRAQVALVSIVLLMILSGGAYAAIFAFYVALTTAYVRRVWLPRDPWFQVALGVGALLVLAARALPAVMVGTHATSKADYTTLPVHHLLAALFLPVQHNRILTGFHETGCYFGLAAIVLVAVFARAEARTHKRLLLAFAFWLWTGSGWGAFFNPWTVHRVVPLFNVAHLQTRLLIIAFLFFLFLLGHALAGRDRRWLLFFAAEALIVHTITINAGYVNAPGTMTAGNLRGRAWKGTIQDGDRPGHYYESEGSVQCYEPSYYAQNQDATVQRDEQIEAFTPGALTLTSQSEGVLTVNTHTLSDWDPPVLSKGPELLRVAVKPGSTVLRYAPRYWWPMWGLLVAGVLTLLGALLAGEKRGITKG